MNNEWQSLQPQTQTEPVPIEIIANEAVEICREYGEHAMTGFVHGVIGKMVNG